MSSDQLKKMASMDSVRSYKDGQQVVVRVSIPTQNLQKVLRVSVDDTIWLLKVQIIEKLASNVADALNYGLHLDGKLLDEKVTIAEYALTDNTSLEFKVKCKSGSEPNTKAWEKENNKKSWKKFMESIQAGKRDEVKAAMAKGVDPNFTAEDGLTPLIKAVLLNDRDMIQVLIEGGAVADYRTKQGNLLTPKGQNALGSSWLTPVHVSAAESKLIALQTLMFFGASCNVYDSGKYTPLYHACTNGHEGIVRWILVWGAINGFIDKLAVNLEEADSSGKTLLLQACSNGFAPIVTLLLEHGADPNAVTSTGNTALHLCCIKPLGGISFKDCTKELLAYGADKDKKNKAGQTAAQIALMSGNMELSDLIKKFTADPHTQKHPQLSKMIDQARIQWGNIGKMMSMGALMTGKPSPISPEAASMTDDHTMNMYGTMNKRAHSPTSAFSGSMRSIKTTASSSQRPGLASIFGDENKIETTSHMSLQQQPPSHLQSRTLTEENEDVERHSSRDSLAKSFAAASVPSTLQLSHSNLQLLRGPQGIQSPLGQVPPNLMPSSLPHVRPPVIQGGKIPGPPQGFPGSLPPMPQGLPPIMTLPNVMPLQPGQFPGSPPASALQGLPPMPQGFPPMPNGQISMMPNGSQMKLPMGLPPMPSGLPPMPQGIPNMPPGRPPMNMVPPVMRPPPQQQ